MTEQAMTRPTLVPLSPTLKPVSMSTKLPTLLFPTPSKFRSSIGATLIALSLLSLSAGCASSGGTSIAGANASSGSRVTLCKRGDTQVGSRNQCLQDAAACYELSNGKWCTGERGNTCPAGSTALATGALCPIGKRCIRVGETLECTIN